MMISIGFSFDSGRSELTPDGIERESGGYFLGHRRLSIVDLSESAAEATRDDVAKTGTRAIAVR